jgi:hypothetical protein
MAMWPNHRYGRRLLGAVALTLLVVPGLAACGGASDRKVPTPSGAAAAATAQPQPVQHLHTSATVFGINAMANATDLGIVGTVVSAGKPYWTTFTAPSGITVPKLIQDVQVRTDKVVIDSHRALSLDTDKPVVSNYPQAVAGEVLAVAAEQQGHALTTPSGATIKQDEMAGPFAAGEQVVLLLQRYVDFPGPSGSRRPALTLLDGWQGHWTVKGQTAQGVDPARSAPLQALVDRLQEEWAAGKNIDRDTGTQENVLARDNNGGGGNKP